MNAKLEAYLNQLRGKKIAVIGIGVSNTPLIKLLLRYGCKVTACDKNDRASFAGLAEEFESLGAELQLGPDYLKNLKYDVIFRTPGMRPDVPELLAAKERGAVITSEMEAFFEVCPGHIIGVTGSDGKTTTTTIISELLKAEGFHVYLGGNIGKPLLAETNNMLEDDWAVVELSSFQLMTMEKSPEIAVVTNVAPNHLDVHKSMAEYVAAKENIFLHQRMSGRLVLNLDNEITRSFAQKAKGEVLFFSRQEPVENGAYLEDEQIYWASQGRVRPLMQAEEIKLPGVHNIENYMAAFCAVAHLIHPETFREVARTFAGVEHRIELVRTLHGVSYYNDSIASSPSRTIAGLNSFKQKVILIAGGYDKHIPFDNLGPEIVEHVRSLILTGNTARQIQSAVEKVPGYEKGRPEIFLYDDFSDAVYAACEIAEPGDVVLLSPACASFDKFKNFAERGRAFKKIIYELE